ncbi:Tyrocidine synthase 3 [Streptomyces sp. YIM 121038]|uniref:non-ribosomal peptide synthetase n=1 Tax=Streptomyces sp. YIM 121038 TaxID=2136401 RepID=UPI0011107979|nr:non-ribosomal peptide synthetase [Streptomyces sp. YIM 121038]QCX80846.1 Tyrocidine synthase 3 [Streptomyces sp. YIM 121038]
MTTPQQVPLSVGQEAMWLAWRLDPQQWIHIIPTPYAVSGDLDTTRLRSAVEAVGHAYPQLRGRIVKTDDGPVLDWADAPPIPVCEHETTLDRDEAVRSVWQRPFDLWQGPLARVDVIRGQGWTVLLVAVHHIVHDGASALVTIDALARAYAGDRLTPGSDVAAQRAFAERSRRLADSPEGDAHRDYWRTALRPTARPFALPATVDEPQYVALDGQVPPDLAGLLRDQARALGVSYTSVLLAAYCALLRRHSGADEVLVFVPFHGRTLEAVQDTVGYFVNTLPVRIDVAACDTYAELALRVRKRVKEAMAHGDLPLPAILRATGATGPRAQADTLQTVFQFWHAGLRDGVDVQHVELRTERSRARLGLLGMESSAGFPLALMVREDSAGTHLLWKDPTGAVGPTRVSAMAADYLEMLRDIAADPGRPVSAVAVGAVVPPATAAPVSATAAPVSATTLPVPAAAAQQPAENGRLDDMVAVWRDVLGVDDITPADSFFELGGHSLLAESLVLAVSKSFGTDVSIRALFDHPYLDEFTDHVFPPSAASVPPVPPARPPGREAPASGAQYGMWLAGLMAPDEVLYNVPMAWRIRGGGLDADVLRHALAGVVARHEILRTAFRQRGDELWQVVEEPWEPELTRVDLGAATAEELDDWLYAESHREFLPESGRLLRAALLDVGGDQVLFLCLHHLVWDAASLDVFLRDLDAAYTARRAHAEPVAPPEALELPVRRPELPGTGHGEITFTVADTPALAAAARDAGSTVRDVLLASWAALLGWYTGRQDLPVAADGRVLRLRPAAAKPFADLLRDVRTRTVDPAPAAAAAFSYADAPAVPGPPSVHLVLRPADGGHTGRLVFDTRRFDHDQMAAAAEHYVRMVTALTEAPEQPLAAAEPLTDVERHTQTAVWNDTAARYPDTPVTDLVRQRAAARPDAVALTAHGHDVTYGDLLDRAEQRARGLVAAGVRPGDLVALLLPRGAEQVVSVLSVLLAGAAYLPLDPAYPAGRVRLVLADSEVRWVLVPEDTDRHEGLCDFTGVVLDTAVTAEADTCGLPVVSLDTPAYCIYTSGTTGVPKGVVISHRNLVRLLRNDRFPFSFSGLDVWTMFHAYTFDVSVWEMFACLSHGGRLVVATDEEVDDPWLFWELLRREGVTVACQTPSAFSRLLTFDAPSGALSRLRHVILAGEALRPATLREWARRFPHVRLVNMYGPTETTVYASVHTVDATDIETGASVIGTPLPTTTLLVLDRHTGSRLLPVGAVGELYIGGAGLADGYLNRPELTAERFVKSPVDGRTLYRTGDLVRYRPDGALEYLGRADDQVKVRGFRIEPGEVEANLRSHPAVAEAVVLADGDRLVATVRLSAEVSAAELRRHTAERLPAHLVPSVFRRVDHIPLTSHGKLDVPTLRETAATLAETAAAPDPAPNGPGTRPASRTERILASLWSELLDVDDVAPDDSFFALGGHSLLAFRLLGRLERVFGTRPGMRELFDRPRLSDLAAYLDAHGAAAGPDTPAPAPAAGPGQPLLAFQERLLLAELSEERRAHNVFLAWTTTGRIDPAVLEQSLADLVAGHEILRTAFVADPEGMYQRTVAPWRPELRRLDLSTAPDADTALTAWLDQAAGQRFDLTRGEPLRAALADLGARGHALLLCLHHLVIDDGSIPVLLSELQRYYLAARDGRTAPPPPRQYREAASHEPRRTTGGAAGLAHWRSRLSDAPAHLDLPPQPHREPDGVVRVDLPEAVTQRLKRIRETHGASWFMLYGAALGTALHRWTGQATLTLAVPVTDRARTGAQDVLGPLLNTVVLRSDLAPGTTPAEYLARFRAELLDAMEHMDVPFEEVVRDLAPSRLPGRTPYADVLLNLNLRDDRTAPLGDATLKPFIAESVWAGGTAFPLTLTVAEQDGGVTALLAHQGTHVAGEGAAELGQGIVRALTELADAPDAVPHAAAGRGLPQYADVATAAARVRCGPDHQDSLDYWERQLAGAPHRLELPGPDEPEPNGAVDVPLPAGLSAALRPLRAEYGLSSYMIASAATLLALHLWTGRSDLVLTSETSTRGAEYTDVIGPLLNTVVFRHRQGGDDTVLDVVLAVRSTVVDALAHSGVSFADVVARLAPPRRPGHTPWGDVALAFEVRPERERTLGGCPLAPVDMSREDVDYIGKTALTISFVQCGDRLSARVAHRGDQVARARTEQFAALLGRLLTGLPTLLDRPVPALPRAGAEPDGRTA